MEGLLIVPCECIGRRNLTFLYFLLHLCFCLFPDNNVVRHMVQFMLHFKSDYVTFSRNGKPVCARIQNQTNVGRTVGLNRGIFEV